MMEESGAMTKVLQFQIRCALAASILLAAGCGAGAGSASTSGGGSGSPTASMPAITTTQALNGAVVVSLSSTTPGAIIYYTVDGSTPAATSQIYQAPFLVSSNLTVNAMTLASGYVNSKVTTQAFTPNIPTDTLVWQDDFSNSTGADAQPNPAVWTYEAGAGGWGNGELENYCAWSSSVAPCTESAPNVYVGTDSVLHIVAEQPSSGVYTSARLKTQGLFSFQYGRIEFKAEVPEAQGFCAGRMADGQQPCHHKLAGLRRNGCNGAYRRSRARPIGTQDRFTALGFTGGNLSTTLPLSLRPDRVHVAHLRHDLDARAAYRTTLTIRRNRTPPIPHRASTDLSGAVWPFDSGQASFIILNLAVGGSWPGPPEQQHAVSIGDAGSLRPDLHQLNFRNRFGLPLEVLEPLNPGCF